jgi:hypothetical protein
MSVFKQSTASGPGYDIHHYPKPSNNTFKINPLVLSSMKHLDVDKLEEDLAKELQKKKSFEDKEKVILHLYLEGDK